MAEYIEREAAIKAVTMWYKKACRPENMSSYNMGERAAYTTAISEITEIPAADVRPVVPGKLIPSQEHPGYLVCSVCHDCYVDPSFVKDNKWNFCPQCGTPWKRDEKPDNSEFAIPNSEFEGGRGNG